MFKTFFNYTVLHLFVDNFTMRGSKIRTGPKRVDRFVIDIEHFTPSMPC